MLKKTYLLSLCSVAVLGLVSPPVQADEQVNTQVTNQSAAAVGDYNQIGQWSTQTSVQQQQRRGRAHQRPNRQDSLQEGRQTAGAVGYDNRILQEGEQVNVQKDSILERKYLRH